MTTQAVKEAVAARIEEILRGWPPMTAVQRSRAVAILATAKPRKVDAAA